MKLEILALVLGSVPVGLRRVTGGLLAEHSVGKPDREQSKTHDGAKPQGTSAKRKRSCSGAQRAKAVGRRAQGNRGCLCTAGRRHGLPRAPSPQQNLQAPHRLVLDTSGATSGLVLDQIRQR